MSFLPGKKQTQATTEPETVAFPGSSFLQVATYDSVNYSLTLDFKNASQMVYRYFFPSNWQQFKESPSKGSFYSRLVKGKYPSVSFKSSLKVSDLEKAIKEHRQKHANFNKTAASKKTNRRGPTPKY